MIRHSKKYSPAFTFQYMARSGYEYPITLPGKRVVCPECDGTGAVLCDSLRDVAFSPDEMDPDFAESYFGGEYDVRCNVCDGENVIVEVDESRLTKHQKLIWDNYCEMRSDIERERAHERSMRERGIQW